MPRKNESIGGLGSATNAPSRKVVMGKRVAAKYIQEIMEPGHTLTVYFNDDRTMRGFHHQIRQIIASLADAPTTPGIGVHPQNISLTTGFDSLTMVVRGDGRETVRERVAKLAQKYSVDLVEM